MTTKAIGQVSRLETVVPAVAKLIAGLADLVLEHDPLARLKVTSSDASRQLYEVDIFSTLTDWEIAGFVAPWDNANGARVRGHHLRHPTSGARRSSDNLKPDLRRPLASDVTGNAPPTCRSYLFFGALSQDIMARISAPTFSTGCFDARTGRFEPLKVFHAVHHFLDGEQGVDE